MLKNKRVGKKIRNIIILLMIIAIMIGAYQNIDRSRAEKVVEVSATALDNYGYLENEEFKLEANQIEDNSYEIQIPECVNNKKINQVVKASIDETNLEIVDNKIYLTKEQLESKNIEIELKYDVAILEPSTNNTYNRILLSEKNDEEIKQIELGETSKKFYYKILKYEDETNGKLVELKGYLPVNAELQVEEVSQEQLNKIFEDKEIKVAYDIKILDKVISEGPVDEANPDAEPEKIVETVEINPEDFGVTCEVTISDANISEKSQVYHVKEDNTYEKINVKENTEGNISFEARTFSVYAVGDDVIDPDPGEDLGSHQYQTRVNYKTSSGKRGSLAALDYQWPTIKVPYGGYVEITNNTANSSAMCICPGGGNCQEIHVSSYTLYPGYYGVYGYSGSGHTAGTYNLYITVEESVPPQIKVNKTSCGWRNSALSLKITASSSVGLSSGNSYQYYLSTSSTALSGGSWIGYSRGASFNINPSSGTYYIFVKRVTDTDGAVSISNGTDVNVGGTTYHRYGPYRFDKIVPTVSNSVTSCSWRNTGLDTTITTTDTGGSELSSSNSYQYYLSTSSTALSGGSWINYSNGGVTNLNPGVSGTYYLFIKRASDNAGNMSTSNGSDVSVSGTIYHRYGPYLFDYDAPIITANPPQCTWRNSELDISLTVSETGGSGLALNNVYEYYFSNSEDTLSGGEWIAYNSGDTIKMNPPTSGVYYLFVKNIYDNTGNVSKSNGSDKTINSDGYQMFGEYQFDYESPEWEIQNLDIDKENDSLTVDIVGKDNLSGIETYLLTANDIVVYVDGTRVDTLTKKLSTATETDEGVVYQLALSNFEEDTKQSGKKYKEWSGDVTLEIAKDTLVDRASNKNIKQTLSLGQVDTLKPVFEYVYSEGNINYVSKSLKVVFSVTDKYFDTTNLNVEDLAILVDNEEPNWETVKREFTSITDITDIVNGVEKVVGKEYTLEISGLEQKYIEEGDKYLNYSGIVTILIPEGKILDTSDNGNNAQTITVGVNIQIQTQEIYASPSQIFDSTGTNANALHIGDFIEYDAGTWTQEEINAIQTGEVGNLVTANGSEELPTENYQFGGFKDGTSRNGNVRPSEWSGVTYDYVKEKTSDGTSKDITGWRVFDINDDGTVTLISAGNPESIYAAWNEAFQVEYILTGQIDERWDDTMSMNPSMLDPSEIAIRKNWEVYVNPTQHAQSATPLTMSSLNNWYSKYVEQTESLFDDTEIFQKIYQEPYFKYQNIVDNYSFYWLCEAQDQFSNFVTWVEEREISANCSDAYGIRMLVTLSSDVLISKTGTKTLTGGNMNTYGGEQTYNVWNIKETEPEKPSELFDLEENDTNGLHIGDFINYDAGTWTQEEINAIKVGPKNNLTTASGTATRPTGDYQFGGFTAGSSKNSSAVECGYEGTSYIQDASTGNNLSGWRVFDIEGDQITLISAGNPEDFSQPLMFSGYQSEYILSGNINSLWNNGTTEAENYQKRDWSNYVNTEQMGESAKALTLNDLNRWFSKYITSNADVTDRTTYALIKTEQHKRYSNMIESGVAHFLCQTPQENGMYENANSQWGISWVEVGTSRGIRVLVTLSSDLMLQRAGTKTVIYDDEQTYNVWNIKQGENDTEQEVSSDPVIVDVVDPAFEIESSQVDIEGTLNSGISKATLIITGTDKYLKDATLRSAETLKVLVNGEEKTEGITKTLGEISDLTEERIIDGVSTTVKYGEKYTITVTGFPKDANQVKIQIPSGVLTDDSGNKNKVTYLVLYNLLRPATNETEATSPFLGESLETTVYPKGQSTVNPIARQDIEKIEFTEDLDGSKVEGVKRIWDVSAQGDETILAWTLQDTAPYTIYIGSETSIYANPDSSYLFSYIGYSDKCTSTETICNLDKLRLYFATNMEAMFSNFGYRSMTSLDLGDNFSTSKITNMANMFNNCGNQKMTSLKLGNNFDTSNVTNMSGMFNSCGYTLLKSLDLGDKFKTSNVFDMTNMFSNCGHLSMTTLDLGPMFTQIAYKHEGFAQNCGTSEIVVYAPETIYLSNTWFKINKKAK